jgi:DNA-binding beta-propeller fold protein YncE
VALQTKSFYLLSVGLISVAQALAQTQGATFGEVVRLGGTPSDVVLDESRQRLYLVNSNSNRIDVYSYAEKRVLGSVSVGTLPFAAAMSMDNGWLYVTNNGSSSLTVIDLGFGIGTPKTTISLPAKPEGVEVGADGRVLISTQGSGTNNLLNVLLIYDPAQETSQQIRAVDFPPLPTTPVTLGQTQLPRPQTPFRGKLLRTPDGKLIVGVNNVNNGAQTAVFVYETASGVLLRSRQSAGQSTTLSMSPDGSKFMAGFTMYDTNSLSVISQQDNRNANFVFGTVFNVTANIGGSTFSPDGKTLFSAYNVASGFPLPRPSASTLLISDSSNLSIKLGIKVPESIVAKLVLTADGADAWALSESGLLYLPLSTLYDYPIIMPDTTTVFLANDDCNKGIAKATVKINNIGSGKLTFSVPSTGAALVAEAASGLAPSTITFTLEPGRFGVQRQPGTNLYAGNNGTAVNVTLATPEAINLPPAVRVFMNVRQSDQRGLIFPVPTVPNGGPAAYGLQDLQLDEARGRLYISNAGYNRVEVFDTVKQVFLDPIPAGQFPKQMALGLDGYTLYVANAGGESISILDLETGVRVGSVTFPPIPRNSASATAYAIETLAMGIGGLQFIMNNGTQWKLVGDLAVPRNASSIINGNTNLTQTAIPAPRMMISSNDNMSILLLGGSGTAYLFDALSDSFTSSKALFTTPIQSYYGPMAAGPLRNYFLTNGLILNDSLTVIGGVERPGQTQVSAPGTPGQPPTVTIVSAGQRNIASVAAVDESRFVRLTTPVRNQLNSATRDDPRTTLEILDLNTGGEQLAGVVPENPPTTVLGTARNNISPRQMVVDSKGTVYVITLSGLSVVPLAPASAATKPAVPLGARAVVNSADGSQNYRPGSFITITGANLANPAQADSTTPPTVLGGSCVVFNDVAIPLLQTSPGQISGQIPANVRSGANVVQVRSLATAQSSDPIVVTVQR